MYPQYQNPQEPDSFVLNSDFDFLADPVPRSVNKGDLTLPLASGYLTGLHGLPCDGSEAVSIALPPGFGNPVVHLFLTRDSPYFPPGLMTFAIGSEDNANAVFLAGPTPAPVAYVDDQNLLVKLVPPQHIDSHIFCVLQITVPGGFSNLLSLSPLIRRGNTVIESWVDDIIAKFPSGTTGVSADRARAQAQARQQVLEGFLQSCSVLSRELDDEYTKLGLKQLATSVGVSIPSSATKPAACTILAKELVLNGTFSLKDLGGNAYI